MKTIKLPRGTARYPHLNEPDEYEGVRKYKVDLVVDGTDPEVIAMIEQLEAIRDEAYDKAVNAEANPAKKKKLKAMNPHPVFLPVLDDEGEETDEIMFRCQSHASYTKNGKTTEIKPTVVDAKKRAIPRNVRVGGGSTLRVAVTPITYQMGATKLYGASLRIAAVQVLKLEQFGGGADMFDEEEDGFDVQASEFTEEDAPAEEPPFDTDDGEAEDDNDF